MKHRRIVVSLDRVASELFLGLENFFGYPIPTPGLNMKRWLNDCREMAKAALVACLYREVKYGITFKPMDEFTEKVFVVLLGSGLEPEAVDELEPRDLRDLLDYVPFPNELLSETGWEVWEVTPSEYAIAFQPLGDFRILTYHEYFEKTSEALPPLVERTGEFHWTREFSYVTRRGRRR